MKKLLVLAAVFAAGFAVTSCSSENDSVVQETSLDNKFDAQGNAYMNIAINLPTARGGATRANEVYADGEANEYKVEDGVLLLFKGTLANEGNATFISAKALDNKVSQGKDGDRITDRILFTQQINKGTANFAGGDGLLAFLVVNHNGMFTFDGDVLKINGTAFAVDSKFSVLKGLQFTNIGDATNGFVMTNAPMSSKAGKSSSPAGADITYLTEIKATDIYNSEADAYNGTNFVDIFVERAAAKVQVTSVASGTLIDGTTTYNAANLKWNIENYNTSYYAERHISESYFGSASANQSTPEYRFVDSQVVGTGFSLYRTYWAEDHNMSAAPDVVTTDAGTQPNVTGWNALNANQYIAENTINQNGMKQGNTTRVVLAVPFFGGNDFYTSSFTGGDQIYSPTDMITQTVAFIKTLPSYATWKATNASNDVTSVTFTNNADGTASVASVVADGGSTTAAILTEVQGKTQFSFYKGGMAYYKVLIKHFGDAETPLGSSISGTGYNDIYGSAEPDRTKNFLGRFGVVRNNWYQIELSGIKHIGKPSVPDIPTDTPDDEIDAYLKVRINILSWGVRKQSVTL